MVPFKVETIDNMEAGDEFNDAFAVSISKWKGPRESILFANRVATLSTTWFGNSPAIRSTNINNLQDILSGLQGQD